MNLQNERSPLPTLDHPGSLVPAAPSTVEVSTTSAASDYLYQFAALTAGAFLLATLL